jgi:hypothetical protein
VARMIIGSITDDASTPLRSYPYHPAAAAPVENGSYLILNNDPSAPLVVTYGMAYFGLSTLAPSQPNGLSVAPGGANPATRLKEVR